MCCQGRILSLATGEGISRGGLPIVLGDGSGAASLPEGVLDAVHLKYVCFHIRQNGGRSRGPTSGNNAETCRHAIIAFLRTASPDPS